VEVTKMHRGLPYKIAAYCTQCPKGIDSAYDGTKLTSKPSDYVCNPIDYYYDPKVMNVFGEVKEIILEESEIEKPEKIKDDIKTVQEMFAMV
jgi:hypothetical protein